MNPLEDLLASLKAQVSEEDREIVEDTAKMAAELFARKLKGDNVDHELDGVKAVALNMSSVAIAKFEETFGQWLRRWGDKLLVDILP